VGVYDAEDAPDPDQITRIVTRFAERGPEVACLQGVLDFYNPTTNWLSRCFTVEYATWFRVILPGLERLGLPIPLGGTTLFFRRAALEDLGGWDAHNVTEDADLGMRLYRHGYRTELIDTVTGEEANCRALPWVKQRSRWLKGYMMTWATHMRDPKLLWRQLGAWKFAGFQVLFLCTLSQFLLLPVLWSFWITVFGIEHPIAAALPGWAAVGLFALFILAIVLLRREEARLTRERLGEYAAVGWFSPAEVEMLATPAGRSRAGAKDDSALLGEMRSCFSRRRALRGSQAVCQSGARIGGGITISSGGRTRSALGVWTVPLILG
jgi:cellulose synthase/poly-beta-1,6-N-acetylglucosamine synthase-like glycosyltransferase